MASLKEDSSIKQTGTQVGRLNMRKSVPTPINSDVDKDTEPNNGKRSQLINPVSNTSLVPSTSLHKFNSFKLTNRQTHVLATLVPDEIIQMQDLEKKESNSFAAVFFSAVVAGVTALCEKYYNTGKGGTHRLTSILNGYIGTLIEVIYSYGGDVLKFSGEEFCAVWKVKQDEFVFQVIHNALECGLCIQQTLGCYETDVKVTVKVKIAISVGNVMFSVIGDEFNRQYVIIGTPVNEAKAAQHICTSGDVILSQSAWSHCNAENYKFSLKESNYVKVTGIMHNFASIRGDTDQMFAPIPVFPAAVKNQLNVAENYIVNTNRLGFPRVSEHYPISEVATLRPSIIQACTRHLSMLLRTFVIKSVVDQVDADQSLEFLCEMHQLTIMIVNLVAKDIFGDSLLCLVDEAYTQICKLVYTSTGYVNKVSIHDKDILFLAVFGLEEHQQDTKSQNGLQCAFSVLKSIGDLDGVKYVSAGVTTGAMFCGVVGHTLRREYLVVGASVNKAAHLVCTYPGKVVCDHTTYLHSKLPKVNFTLQESIEVKGLKNTENIYEYDEDKRDGMDSLKVMEFYPLLGREEHLNTYGKMLERDKDIDQHASGLVIEGEACIGKSRLLAEFIIQAPQQGYTSVSISLSQFHHTLPYSLIYEIIRQVLQLSKTVSIHDRQERLVAVLADTCHDLCYLNEIMHVKFPQNVEYLNESPKNRIEKQQKILQDLLGKCCSRLVIIIDDAHFIDTTSLSLLTALLSAKSVLLVMAMNADYKESHADAAKRFIEHPNILKIHLGGLEAHYMAPLACQLLGVNAISCELESCNNAVNTAFARVQSLNKKCKICRILQSQSNGNPGWCLSFLSSLLITSCLQIKEVSESELKQHFLVLADAKVITKTSEKSVKLRDAEHMEDELSEKDSVLTQSDYILACVFTSNYATDNDLVRQTLDAVTCKIFHSLTPQEQQLLRCASVLGKTFPRPILNHLMNYPSPQFTAEAIKHLFDTHVFKCGTDIKYDLKNCTEITETESLRLDHNIKCYCTVKPKDKNCCPDLPKYAFCQLLCFKIPLLQVITYKLLHDNQRINFHAQALEFLECEVFRCVACKQRDNSLILQEENQKETHHKVDPLPILEETEGELSPEVLEIELKERITSRSKNNRNKNKTWNLIKQNYTEQDTCQTLLSLIPTSSVVNFHSCKCPFFLNDSYQTLVYHSGGAGLIEKQIVYLIEHAKASITLGKNIQAISLLKAAVLLLQESRELKIPQETQKFNSGRIHSLLGQAYLDLGYLDKGKFHLFISLRKFGCHFPERKPSVWLKLQWQTYCQTLHRLFPRVFLRHTSHDHSVISTEKALALSHLSNIFMLSQEWVFAKIAALWSLNSAQVSKGNMSELCAAYSNMIDICHHHGMLQYSKSLENIALMTCKGLHQRSETQELLALGRLYCAIFNSRLFRGEIQSAITIGFKTVRICSHMCANNFRSFILPTLIQAMVLNVRLDEAIDLLRDLSHVSGENLDKSMEIWYYALSVDMLLDTGFTFESATKCWHFAHKLILRNNKCLAQDVVRDPDSLQRLVTSMWVWCIRLHQERLVKMWGELAIQYLNIEADCSFSSLFSSLRFLEGVLLIIAFKLRKPKQIHVLKLYVQASNIINQLENVAKDIQVIQPRFLHLKAYYNCIRHNKDEAVQILKEGLHCAQQQHNILAASWIQHSLNDVINKLASSSVPLFAVCPCHVCKNSFLQLWTGQINIIDKAFWEEHVAEGNYIDWHEYIPRSLPHTTYSLQIPKYSV